MEEKKFAVLIDSDNVSSKYVKIILDEITNLGVATIKRIYGDWTSGKTHWKSVLLDYALTPMQQYAYTSGKNSTDSAMIIDAMDILYTGDVDGFCIASSDSDFTKLATRLREAGKIVIGMGEKHTPQPFVKACSQFKYIDLIAANQGSAEKANKQAKPNNKSAKSAKSAKKGTTADKTDSAAKAEAKSETVTALEEAPTENNVTTKVEDTTTPIDEIKSAVLQIMEDSDDESGLVPASKVGTILQNRFSDFDCRNYGCKKMADLLKKLHIPTVKYSDPNNPIPNAAILYIKVK
ncbi:MAG: NYN domain-containing protein [Clostridiales bacterium]|nr:NYN domain-containing protein [Clostridiales bacterium]